MRANKVLAGLWLFTVGLQGCSGSSEDDLEVTLDGSIDSGSARVREDAGTMMQHVRDDMDAGGDGGPLDADVGSDASPALDASDELDANDGDTGAPSDAETVADAEADASDPCNLGSAQNSATTGTLDIFGQITYFANGDVLPAGTYRVVYEDGCLKYGPGQDWTIHAYASPNEGFAWFVGATAGDRIVRAPGTSGYAVANGAFAEFDDCVAANLLRAPVEFTHTGSGKLGIWLADSQYGDNLVGLDNRNPRWRLERVDCGDGGP